MSEPFADSRLNILLHCATCVHTEMSMDMAIGINIYIHADTGEKGTNEQRRGPGWGVRKYLQRYVSGISFWEKMKRAVDI